MSFLGVAEPRWFRFRRILSFLVWLGIPSFTLLLFRNSPLQEFFRMMPYSSTRDLTVIGAGVGIALVSILILRSKSRLVWYVFDLIEILGCAGLGARNWMSGARAAGLLWIAALMSLAAGSALVWVARKQDTSCESKS